MSKSMFVNFMKKQTTYGLRVACRNVMKELRILRKHRNGKRQVRYLLERQHLKLNIGCGPKVKSGWINVDLSPHADIALDLREPLPFRDNSCSIIYSEHFLEHLEYPLHAKSFLVESYRVLEPEGVISIGAPDTEWPLAEYVGTRCEDYFNITKDRWAAKWCQTQMEIINYHFRQDGDHLFAYDFVTLAQALSSAGFQGVIRRDFDLGLDSVDRKLGTLYVNAFKLGTR